MIIFTRQHDILHYLPLFLPLLFISCSDNSNHRSDLENVYNLNTHIEDREVPDRKIRGYAIENEKKIMDGEDYFLHTPQSFDVGSKGKFIYVFDYGDMKVKEFDTSGQHLGTYGKGKGNAPGKVKNIANAGPIGDSTIYIVDQRSRKINFFRKDGSFKKVKSFKNITPNRYGKNKSGLEYLVTMGMNDFFTKISYNNRQETFRKFNNDHFMTSGGVVETYKNKAIYIPSFYPVLIEYRVGDTSGTAYPTPDYGNLDTPSADVREGNGVKRVGAPPTSEIVHFSTALIDDTLSVQIPCPEAEFDENTCFDLYEAEDLSYIKSIRTPIDKGSANYWSNTVVSEKDTAVFIHEVSNESDG